MYLSDLTFIEEGTPNFTENGLLNFAKMRMVRIESACFLDALELVLFVQQIAHVIREIRQFQQTPYKIERIQKVQVFLKLFEGRKGMGVHERSAQIKLSFRSDL